jgi:hypothetical protein
VGNRWIAGAAVFLGAYLALSAYSIKTQNIEELLLCADKGGLKVPFSRSWCRHYLFAFRGTPEDIESLHRDIGASFVVQGQSSAQEREEVLRFLIAKGLDVNRIDRHKLTPLHAAVLANSVPEVQLLLRNGARLNVTDERFGLTPPELALKLQRDGKSPNDWHAVISLLHAPR